MVWEYRGTPITFSQVSLSVFYKHVLYKDQVVNLLRQFYQAVTEQYYRLGNHGKRRLLSGFDTAERKLFQRGNLSCGT